VETIANSKNVVVIVGAGVSTECQLPLGERIKEIILESLADGGIMTDRILVATNFFSVLSEYRSLIGDIKFFKFLRSQLRHEFTQRMEAVSTSYEILAHLLHHDEITAVVSLNFDELIDKAVALESRSADNSTIITPRASLSEFQALLEEFEQNKGHAPRKRQLLKPHGTISKTLSIRLSAESIRTFEPSKEEVLKHYLQDADVLVLGWNLGDPDLLRILFSTDRPLEHPVFVVSPDRPDKDGGKPSFSATRFKFVNMTSAKFLEALVAYMENRNHKDARAPAATEAKDVVQGDVGMLRHKIRGLCFAGNPPLFQATLERQLAVEIVMHALKARGQFEPAILFDCPRIAYLAEVWNDDVKRSDPAVATVLAWLCHCDSAPAVLAKGTNEVGEPVYWLNVKNDQAVAEVNDILHLIAEHSCSSLVATLPERPGDCLGLVKDKNVTKDLISCFEKLTKSFDIDFESNPRTTAAFVMPKKIANRRDFALKTHEVLSMSCAAGDFGLCISTATGEWLLRDEFRDPLMCISRAKKLIVLVDNLSHFDKSPYTLVRDLRVRAVKERFSDSTILALGRKVHNLTAVMDSGGRFRAAIYFRRESKTPGVSPVYLDHPDDLAILETIWASMIERAECVAFG
jgi:hypothetical protein